MKLRAEIITGSEETKGFDFDSGDQETSGELCFGEGRIRLNILRTNAPSAGECGLCAPFAISFRSDCDMALACFRLRYDLTELTEAEDAVFYNAATCTNDFASVEKLRPDSVIPNGFSRDLFLAQGNGLKINIAFVTFRRFFTKFLLCDHAVIAEQALENKTVKAGAEYQLEHMLMDDQTEAGAFFEQYTVYLSATHDIPEFKYIPKGFSSWSCYYSQIDEERILKQADWMEKELLPAGGDLLQLDDGWQKEGSFGAYWTTDSERFPDGMDGLQKKLSGKGIRFGIWMAPGLIKSSSTRFSEFQDILVKDEDGQKTKCFDNGSIDGEPIGVFAMDLGKEGTYAHTEEMFRRGKEVFHSEYFKIDFITNLLFRAGNGCSQVIYESDYSVALYRRWTQFIREIAGKDTFLLACGAPIGESAGVFDGIRVSPDITWGGAGKNGLPTPYELIVKNAQNIILRSPYNRRVFLNDPDALLARDYFTEYGDDGLAMTDDEAMLWATVVSNCGGHILLNEEIDKLPEKRLAFIKRIMKDPLPTAARPKDFFEYPLCTQTYLPFEDGAAAEDIFYTERKLGLNGTVLCTVYNWEETSVQKEINILCYFCENVAESHAFCARDRWEEDIAIEFNRSFEVMLKPHSCRSFYISPITTLSERTE